MKWDSRGCPQSGFNYQYSCHEASILGPTWIASPGLLPARRCEKCCLIICVILVSYFTASYVVNRPKYAILSFLNLACSFSCFLSPAFFSSVHFLSSFSFLSSWVLYAFIFSILYRSMSLGLLRISLSFDQYVLQTAVLIALWGRSSFWAYFSYFEKNRLGLWDHVAVSVCVVSFYPPYRC
jgi:hypothetical protein